MCECDPTSPATIPGWLVTARAVHFAACLLLFGLPAFDRLIARRGVWPRDGSPRDGWPPGVRGLAWVALPAALLSGAAWLLLVTSDACECTPRQAMSPDLLRSVCSETHFGRLWQLRSVFWLATAAFLVPGLALARLRFLRAVSSWAALLCGGALLGSLAWAGHGPEGAGPAAPIHLPADVVHLLVSGLWPTGLLPFGLLLLRLRRTPGQSSAVATLTRRFSAVSLTSVVLLTATGMVNSWFLVGSLQALTATPYGKVLLVKTGLFAVMVALGAVNLLCLKPCLSSAGLAPGALGGAAPGRLQFNVTIEFLLGTLVVVAVALLGVLPPAVFPPAGG